MFFRTHLNRTNYTFPSFPTPVFPGVNDLYSVVCLWSPSSAQMFSNKGDAVKRLPVLHCAAVICY